MIVFFYFIREVLPQFITSLCVISAVLVISQLVKLSDALATFGFSLENILLPFLFIILPFLYLTIPISYLFAVLLGFSRLSVDGEMTALLAAGFSLKRASYPILLLGMILYMIAVVCGLELEPWGRRELLAFYEKKAQSELDNMIRFRLKPGVFMDDFLGFTLYVENISEDRSRFENVLLAPRPGQGLQRGFVLMAPTGAVTGSVETADLRMSFDYGVVYSAASGHVESTVVKFKRAEIDIVRLFRNRIFDSDDSSGDYKSMNTRNLWQYIEQHQDRYSALSSHEKENLRKARFLFHKRIAFPFAVISFALFAIVIGVHDPRRGKSGAWLNAILTILSAYVVMMAAQWAAENGYLSEPLAAWLPNILLTLLGLFLLYQKNRLPPSESILDPRHIPGLSRFFTSRNERYV